MLLFFNSSTLIIKIKVSLAENQHISMIAEGSCDIEDTEHIKNSPLSLQE